MPSERHVIGRKFILQQDMTTNIQGVLEIMIWLLQSPNVNMISSVWDYVKRQKDSRQHSTINDLWLDITNMFGTSGQTGVFFIIIISASAPWRIDAVTDQP